MRYPYILTPKMYVLTRIVHTKEYGTTTIFKENIAVFESDALAYEYLNDNTAEYVAKDDREIALDYILHLSRTQRIDEETFNFIIDNPEYAHSSTFSKEIYYKIEKVSFIDKLSTGKRKRLFKLESLDDYKKSIRPLFFDEEGCSEKN